MHTSRAYENFLEAVSDAGLKIITPVAGESFGSGGLTFTVLAPNSDNYADLNNYSVALMMEYGGARFLFTGDAEEISENEMLASSADLSADALKVAHHGSYSSSSADFITAVAPAVAVISCGRGNQYGHPHETTIDLLTAAGVQIYRTDQLGTVILLTDGDKIVYSGQD